MNNMDLKFMDAVKKIVYFILRKENILQNQWHVGTVSSVLSRYRLKVYIDGSDIEQLIPCNPNIEFVEGEKVWVLYINGDSKNKYVPFKRSTGQELV